MSADMPPKVRAFCEASRAADMAPRTACPKCYAEFPADQRAAALPEDAEEIVFKELSIGVVEPQDLEIQEAIHAKRRAKARAVVKALRAAIAAKGGAT